MKIFFDTEFHEDGQTIDLISIGLLAEDGREYYAVSNEFDIERAYKHEWLKANVLPDIEKTPIRLWKPRHLIASEIVAFVGDNPEFWADYASYDWVALCQLYGTMMDLPQTWPMFCMDVQQLKAQCNVAEFPEMVWNEHSALDDAKMTWARWQYLTETQR